MLTIINCSLLVALVVCESCQSNRYWILQTMINILPQGWKRRVVGIYFFHGGYYVDSLVVSP